MTHALFGLHSGCNLQTIPSLSISVRTDWPSSLCITPDCVFTNLQVCFQLTPAERRSILVIFESNTSQIVDSVQF